MDGRPSRSSSQATRPCDEVGRSFAERWVSSANGSPPVTSRAKTVTSSGPASKSGARRLTQKSVSPSTQAGERLVCSGERNPCAIALSAPTGPGNPNQADTRMLAATVAIVAMVATRLRERRRRESATTCASARRSSLVTHQ